MLKSSARKTDEWLWRRGFRASEIRLLLRCQMLVSGVSLLAGVACAPLRDWGLWFGVGAALSTFNFYALARFVQGIVFLPYTRAMAAGLMFRFYGRLLLTGLALFGLIVWLKVSVTALLAGLSTCVLSIAAWGIARGAGQKVKEA